MGLLAQLLKHLIPDEGFRTDTEPFSWKITFTRKQLIRCLDVGMMGREQERELELGGEGVTH